MASHRLQLGQLSGMEVDGVPPPMRHSCLVWASEPTIDRIDQPDVFSSQLRTSLVSFYTAASARLPFSPVVPACCLQVPSGSPQLQQLARPQQPQRQSPFTTQRAGVDRKNGACGHRNPWFSQIGCSRGCEGSQP